MTAPSPAPLTDWRATWPDRPRAEPVRAARAMVATTDRYASEVGLEILRGGGNAVDAAVAASFALAVVNPEAGNLGGSGFMVVRTADGAEAALDFRGTAPRAATADMFVDARGEVGEAAVIGHRSVATPGSVLGLEEAWRRFGVRPWSDLVEPAVALARGFAVGERFLRSFTPDVVAGLARFPASAHTFLPGGAPPPAGTRFAQPELARALERIRDRGAGGFYRGETAALIAAEMERGGGILSRADLAAYRVVWREPVRFRYRGRTVVSMPPPSSGGVALAESAHILAPFSLGDLPWHGAAHVHLLAEAWRRAFADRNRYLADPGFVAPPAELLWPAYGAWRGRDIARDRATPSAAVAPALEAFRREGAHTTHVSVVDAARNAVSLTTTVNSWYGSKVVVAGGGFVLNNDMDDFAARPGAPNQFGLVQGRANRIEPGKRMLSAMAPVIVLGPDGALDMVAGTPGGATIITTVFQILSNVLDHRMNVAEAVLAPRVHHQHLPDQIACESGGLAPGVVGELEAMGHRVVARPELSGDAEVIAAAPDGTLSGQADPRRGGAALGD